MVNRLSAPFVVGFLAALVLSAPARAQTPLRVGIIFSVTQAPLWAGMEVFERCF